MSANYSYQLEEPRSSGALHPGWTSNMQYPSYSTPMERGTSQGSNSTGTSNQAAWSPQSEEPSYVLGNSPVTPTSASSSRGYYSGDTQATVTGNSEGDWSLYYNFIVPKDQRKEAYWELQDQYEPSESLPERRPVERQKKSGREVYPCLFPGCTNSKPFKRTADLQRHYTQLHAPPNPSLKFFCDYPRCLRATEPLGRKDHYRDHLREYHGEDLVKRAKDHSSGGRKSKSGSGKGSGRDGSMSMSSMSRVNVSEKWWRCTKCLERKNVCDGWFCHGCKRDCEAERVANRMKQYQNFTNQASNDNAYNTSSNLNYYSDNDDEVDNVVKTEIITASPSASKSQYHYPSGTGTSSRVATTQQGSNGTACIYGCNNTWVYNSITNDWDPCPTCQAPTAATTSLTSANDIDTPATSTSTYRVSYTASSSAWNPSPTSYGNQDDNLPATSLTSTPATTEYESNCGHCSNYMVWDGTKWSNCPRCYGDQSGSGGGGRSERKGHGGREKEKEKDKKKSRRSSTLFW